MNTPWQGVSNFFSVIFITFSPFYSIYCKWVVTLQRINIKMTIIKAKVFQFFTTLFLFCTQPIHLIQVFKINIKEITFCHVFTIIQCITHLCNALHMMKTRVSFSHQSEFIKRHVLLKYQKNQALIDIE